MPIFQTRISQNFISSYNKSFNNELKIDNVDFNINGKINLNGFLIKDHHGDTIVFGKKITSSMSSFRNIIDGKINFNSIKVEGFKLKIIKYINESETSLVQFLNSKNDNDKNFLNFKSNEINVKEGFFEFRNENNTSDKSIIVNNFSFKTKEFNILNDQINFKIDSLKLYSKAENFQINYFKSEVKYNPSAIYFNDFNLKNNILNLKGTLNLSSKDKSSTDFISSLFIDFKINNSSVKPSFFENDNFSLNTDKELIFDLTGTGTLKKLFINEMTLNHPLINYSGSSDLINIIDPEKYELKSIVNNFNFSTDLFSFKRNLSFNKSISFINNHSIKGEFNLFYNSLKISLSSFSESGSFALEGFFDNYLNTVNNKKKFFDFKLKLKNFIASSIIKKSIPFSFDGEIYFSGSGSDIENIELKWISDNLKVNHKKNKISKINFEGYFKKQQFHNTITINDNDLQLKSDFRFDYSKKNSSYSSALNIIKLDLNSFGYNFGDGKAVLSGIILSDIALMNKDSFEGYINISSLKLINNDSEIFFNPISLTQKNINGEKSFVIENSDIIKGNISGSYKISQIIPLLKKNIHKFYPFFPDSNSEKNQSLSFDFIVYNKFIDALYPKLSFGKSLTLKGFISSDELESKVFLEAPVLIVDKFILNDVSFKLNNQIVDNETSLLIGGIKNPWYDLKEINLKSFSIKDTLFVESNFLGGSEGIDDYNLKMTYTIDNLNNSFFDFKNSKISYKNKPLILITGNNNKKTIVYNNQSKRLNFNNIYLKGRDEHLSFSGSIIKKEISSFSFDIKNFRLEDLNLNNPTFSYKGMIDLNLDYSKLNNDNIFKLNSKISNLSINDRELGLLNITTTSNPIDNEYSFLMDLQNSNIKNIQAKGRIIGIKSPLLDIDFSLKNLDLSFLSRLGKKSINKIHGLASGEFNLKVNNRKFSHTGELEINNAGLSIPYLNVSYFSKKIPIELKENLFYFKKVRFSDTKENTEALLEGSFTHDNFYNWDADLKINSERLLILDKPMNELELFYGKGFFKGNVLLNGPTRNLSLNMNGSTEDGTSIKIPWTEDYGISENNFVNFINKKSNFNFPKKSNSKSYINEIRGLEMDFQLDLTNKAEVEIVIDKDTGSYLTGRGEGSLIMEINTNGKFNMWGDFITSQGIYNFKNLGLIDKKLRVSPGGRITWEGDPLDAKMDIEAIYEVPGGANPAILLDNPNFNKKIPTDVKIRLQGSLLKPDNPVFEINFPNTSGSVESEINYRLSDPQVSQLQSLSLLSQGIFINDVSVSMQGITNNLYQKASDVFTSLLGEENEKLKVGVDYLQGDKSAILDIATEDRLGFTLSTKISDKILLNGKIGVPIGGLEQTLIVGNIQIDFLLNDEGSLKAKVFSKENEFRYIGDELGYTQGLGLSYQVDFDTFRSLITKISKKKNKIDSIKTKISKIIFIDKN